MSVVRDGKYVTLSVLASIVFASLRAVLVLRFLGPVLMGAWKSALLVDTLGEFARLGVLRAMGIRVPVLDGKGDVKESARITAIAGSFMFWLGIVLGLTIFGVSFFFENPDLRISLRFVALAVAVTQPYYFLRELAGVKQEFVLRSKETLLRSAFDFIVAVVCCKFLGLYGLGLATSGALIAAALYLLRKQRVPFQIKPDIKGIKELIRTGIPFSLTEAGYELLRRLDVLLMAFLLGPAAVGYYGVSLLIMDVAIILTQKGISQVVSPHLLKEFGRTGSFSAVAVYYEVPARLFCYVLPPLLGAGTFLVGVFVRLALPQYGEGIEAAEVTLWAVFFVALHFSINAFFIASNMVPRILKLDVILIPIAALAQYTLMDFGWGIAGAAWCNLVTLALAAACELYIARSICGHDAAEIARFVGTLYFPLACSIALKMFVDTWDLSPWLASEVLQASAKAALFLVLSIPVFATYEGKFAMLRAARQAM